MDQDYQINATETPVPIGSKKLEKAPLLSTQRRLFRSLSGVNINMNNIQSNNAEDPFRTLGTFSGVFAPVSLSQISTLLFLRLGFVIGNVGLLLGCGTLGLAYLILLFTILSICAISTNGAVEGGGAYFMISRTLGPEFGGAIGALFFFANVFSSALYVTGCIEGILENFGEEAGDAALFNILPEGVWYNFAYASALNFLNLLVCLIGAKMFAKTTVVILAVVLFCTASVIISFLSIHYLIEVPIPLDNPFAGNQTGNYTGFSLATLNENLYPSYTTDYTTDVSVDFATVFGVLFTGITGIMAGANMSGELKEPGRSIPVGTLLASCFTFTTYLILLLLTASTTSQFLLQNNYMFMMDINLWPPFVTIGVITATLSASLSCIIGASRILAALVKDNIYGRVTKWIGLGTVGNNPIGAVVVSAVFVEFVFLIGELNTIARFTSVFFLLSYLATNLACLSLEWASAPNFRPTFPYFAWWTAALGIFGSGAMMFVISPIASAICIIIVLILVIILHLVSPSEHHNWGSISQALIFHQVRKYLLLLDARKDHVKFWRPQILLMVANPRSSCPLIDFVNDLKKSGLYILGHVKVDETAGSNYDPVSLDITKWQCLVDHLKVKAFIEVTISRTLREGMQQLMRTAGLGAMKPNTVILGFSDCTKSEDFFSRETSTFYVQPASEITNSGRNKTSDASVLGYWQREGSPVEAVEFVSIIRDVLLMGKNVCVCRHFQLLDKEPILKSTAKEKMYIDIWPMNFLEPSELSVFDTSSLFLLQLATVLNMVSTWNKKTLLRVFLCVSSRTLDQLQQEEQVRAMLHELRIQASIVAVTWEDLSDLIKHDDETAPTKDASSAVTYEDISESYLTGVNQLIRDRSQNTAVSFMYLPRPPPDATYYPDYLKCLSSLTQHLHPTVMVHGVSAVTTTNL